MKRMAVKQICWVLAGLAAACCTEAGGETFTFQQGKDHGWGVYTGAADITLDNPIHNDPTETERLRVMYSTAELHNVLIRFRNLENNLADTIVQSAILTLTFQDDDLQWKEAIINIYPVLRDWDNPNWTSTGLTEPNAWAELGAQGAGSDRGDLILSQSMGPRKSPWTNYTDNDPYDFELPSSLVQNWIDNPSENYGIILTMAPSAATSVTFSSCEDNDESGNYCPKLVIEAEPFTCTIKIPADVNGDCYVDLYDMVEIAGNWLASGNLAADISEDNYVDLEDFSIISRDWLLCSDPGNPDCTCGKYRSDLDGNCVLDILDLVILADQWLAESGGTADLNEDGKVNLLDYAVFVQDWQAEYSPCEKYIADLDGNCTVDILDLAVMADQWLSETGGTADLNKDGKVNLLDYVIFLQEWYEQQPDPE